MASTTTTLTDRDAYRALETHHAKVAGLHLRDLFAEDPERGDELTAEGAGLYLDYSKHRVTDETVGLLVALAEESGLRERIDAMFRGDKINVDRESGGAPRRAAAAARAQRSGRRRQGRRRRGARRARPDGGLRRPRAQRASGQGHTGKRIRNVVNIGIGGSDLGPVMAYEALRHYSRARPDLPVRVERRRHRLRRGDPRPRPGETLFIVSSKTFTTLETLTNAHSARDWLRWPASAATSRRSRSTSSRSRRTPSECRQFGIDTANMFGFWDWVGGRYSMDSAIGLSTMLAIGPDGFAQMLAGFHAMDEHFRTAPFARTCRC